MSTSSTTSSSLIRRSTNLNPEETDLWELCYYAGVTIDPQVFHVLVDLLHMDIHPKAVLDVLKSIAPHSKYATKERKKATEVKKSTSSVKSISQKPQSSKVASTTSKSVSSSTGNENLKGSSLRSTSLDKQSATLKNSKGRSSSASTTKQVSDRSASNVTTRR